MKEKTKDVIVVAGLVLGGSRLVQIAAHPKPKEAAKITATKYPYATGGLLAVGYIVLKPIVKSAMN